MAEPRKLQVSLRGASAREISRNDLLQKVNHERELRNYTRRASAAALFVQRVWRRHTVIKSVALELQQQFETMLRTYDAPLTRMQISCNVLRPFLLFTRYLLPRSGKSQERNISCIRNCFNILLASINSADPLQNFCSLVIGIEEEKATWLYQSKKMVSLCLYVISEFDNLREGAQDAVLTPLAMRLMVILTDLKGWKSIPDNKVEEAETTLRNLMCFMGSKRSGLYTCIRRYMTKLEPTISSPSVPQHDTFLVTASAITLALRPFYCVSFNLNNDGVPENAEIQEALEQYCILLLTIPWLGQRLPDALLPALRHTSVLSPSLRMILMSKDRILKEISGMNQLELSSYSKEIPEVGWLLANIIYLATECENFALDSGRFTPNLEYASYVDVVTILSERLLVCLDNIGWPRKEDGHLRSDDKSADIVEQPLLGAETTVKSLNLSYIDLFRPICQQWHLMKLLSFTKYSSASTSDANKEINPEHQKQFDLLGIAQLYSCMLRTFSILDPFLGSLPVLNMLAFTPGFLTNVWDALEKSIFNGKSFTDEGNSFIETRVSELQLDETSGRKLKLFAKDGGNKWFNVLHKITKKPPVEHIEPINVRSNSKQINNFNTEVWDIEQLRQGPESISNDISCLLHLFCATYSHLLLVLDDIEFYEKQVPFTLEHQRRIASILNTLVYNALCRSIGPHCRPLIDSAIRCLHMLYERDCRHQFCPPALWLSPGRNNRPPIAVAARTRELLSSTARLEESAASASLGSVISVTPHVFPFEERVEMFREFINMDKASRKMAGEAVAPGRGSIEIVIRRDHIVEDGFQQLNSLGSRLKSNIHVSFISESGVQEAGLDFGGLSKEFLTDIAKAAFSPDCGLFLQTSTSDRHLMPNATARFLEKGIQMIEFLGRIVGKALYEGILLDYSFSQVFVQKLLGRYSFLDELSSLDPELYKNLMYVKHYDGDVKDLSLDFTVTEESLGRRNVIELKPGGKDICVTNENKLQYIYAIADYKLNRQIIPFSNAFYRGFTDLIAPIWLKLFNASEFNQVNPIPIYFSLLSPELLIHHFVYSFSQEVIMTLMLLI
ncbi:hypothetical protein Leryth_009680 [Lithospermum erythrorhizon]|nr:hypothetical protein Leryth_009680 [Lithospermum erythrorhizon]